MPRLTIRDLAAAAGVSPGAASLILRHGGRFSPATRERVLATARRIGYRPDPLAAARRTGKYKRRTASQTVPVAVIYRFDSPLRPAAVQLADQLGYELQAYRWSEGASPQRLGDVLFSRGVRGVILTQLYGVRTRPDLGWHRFSAIAAGRPFFDVGIDVVTGAVFDKVVMAWRTLREHGWERIGFDLLSHQSWGEPHPDDALRYGAAAHCQREVAARHRIPILMSSSGDEDLFRRWLLKHRPDALICSLPQRFIQLREFGWEVPAEISLLALECRGQPARPARPRISGFLHDSEAVMVGAVQMLDRLIRWNVTGLREDPLTHLVAAQRCAGETLRRAP